MLHRKTEAQCESLCWYFETPNTQTVWSVVFHFELGLIPQNAGNWTSAGIAGIEHEIGSWGFPIGSR